MNILWLITIKIPLLSILEFPFELTCQYLTFSKRGFCERWGNSWV